MKSRKYLNNIFCLTHPDEKLNLICAERHCPHRGLLCQLCKLDENESHLSHLEAIIPFKYFIESLEANLDDRDQQINSITEQSCLSRLQKLRDEMLVRLSLSVQEVARMVSELEERIMREYEASKQKVLQKSMVFRQYQSCIERCIIHNIRKEEKFELIAQMKNIVEHIKPIDLKESKGGNKFVLDSNGKHIIANFIEQNENLKIDCERLEQEVKSIFGGKHGQENSPLQRFQRKRELVIFEQESKCLLEAKRKEDKSKLLKEEELEKKKDQKKKEKKKDEQEKKNKKQSKNNKEESEKLTNLTNSLLSFKKEVLPFITQEEAKAIFIKKPPKISFADFAEEQMKLQSSKKELGSKAPIFSSLFKGIPIKVHKHGRSVKQTTSDIPAAGFAIISEALEKCKKISYRVVKVKTEVYLGVAKHESIAAKKYTFQMNALGHGAYMISSKGVVASSLPAENNQHLIFSFEEGDIINLIFEEGKLIFQRHPSKKLLHEVSQDITLNTGISEEETRNFNFCVFLGGNGDTVEII